jgi:putative aldouronate transport system permease protein
MNMIIARTYFQSSIPKELYDCSALDGASDLQILRHVVVPLSKPLLAVLALYYAIDHWNSYFDALIYLSRKQLLPLQIVIREYVFTMMIDVERESAEAMQVMARREVLKYGLIVMGSLPVILMYPFIQKYFTKGVMIGSLKG